MCVCVFISLYTYVLIVLNLYMCIQLYGTKGINDVALKGKQSLFCLFVREHHAYLES